MAVQFLKPMLDPGSSRVFNFNIITRMIKAKDPNAPLFFRNPPLNNIVLIKDTVPEFERKGMSVNKPIGTKLYFPFNENEIYEGGRTIFLHAKNLQQAIIENVGMKASLTQEMMAEDVRILQILDDLPSLDPFLMKDIFFRAKLTVNEAYFEISPELWQEIETYVLQSFEPLVTAAFPDAKDGDERARALVEKIWEARDEVALQPLISALRLPQDRALEIFAAWKGVNYYSFQHKRAMALYNDLIKWLKAVEIPAGAMTAPERTAMKASIELSLNTLRAEWQKVEKILNDYTDGYDKMFKHKISSAPFLEFLRNCSKSYWDLGQGLGRVTHATYCWDVTTKRHPNRKSPWPETAATLKLLAEILKTEAKATSAVSW